MIWTISSPCSRAGERAHPTKPTHKHPAKPFPRITRQSPRTFRPGALPRAIRCALIKPSPLRGRWRGGHAATDEVSLDIHRTTGAAGKNRNISTSSGKQSLPPSPQGEGSARGGSAPPPFPYRIQKALGHCVRGLCRASPQNLSRAAKHAQPQGSPRGQGRLGSDPCRKPSDIVSGGSATLLLKTCHAQQNTHNRGGARGGKAHLGSDPYRKPSDIVSGGLSASSYSPAAHSVYARLLLPQAQAVGDHGDELRIRRLALDVRDRVAEKLLQRLDVAAVPRDLDRVPDGALDA